MDIARFQFWLQNHNSLCLSVVLVVKLKLDWFPIVVVLKVKLYSFFFQEFN